MDFNFYIINLCGIYNVNMDTDFINKLICFLFRLELCLLILAVHYFCTYLL